MVDEAGLRELEPLARTHERALWSPSTAVADPVAVVEALAARVRERGDECVLDDDDSGKTADFWRLASHDDEIRFRRSCCSSDVPSHSEARVRGARGEA